MASKDAAKTGRVLIAGGGVAALEGALALRDLAGDAVELTLLAPRSDFVYRPAAVGEPFSFAAARRYPLAEIASDVGARLIAGGLAWVDAPERIAHTESRDQLEYDALLIAVGARTQTSFDRALTIDDARLGQLMHELVTAVEAGKVRRLAFVVPSRTAWPLPAYELALMTAWRGWDRGVEDMEVSLVTPEETPLEAFGPQASAAVATLLSARGVRFVTSVNTLVPSEHLVLTYPDGEYVRVDRVIALPELYGPDLRGLHNDPDGFIPVDRHCRVRGVEHVWAAGDATAFPIKHGGLAARQADAAARSIAATVDRSISPEPLDPVIRGMLLTGGQPRYLSARLHGEHGVDSRITDDPSWSPPAKIDAPYLAPYLDRLDAVSPAVPAGG